MTYAITQYAWFRWFDQDNNRIFDDRAILFQAVADGNETSTHVALHGTTYDIEVTGIGLLVDSGQLSGGTANTITVFDGSTGIKLVEASGMTLDVASFLSDYENDVSREITDAVGYIFDASAVAAQPNGDGIGTYGANNGDDTMFGSAGSDELIGYRGNDEIHGNAGNDLLWGEEGNDRMFGGVGDDDLRGYTGNDLLKGEAGKDQLAGWTGNDTLDGGSGNDFVYGGVGKDDVSGGKGNDFLIGDAGKDTLRGGDGRDWATASLDSGTAAFTIDLAGKTIKSSYGTDTLSSIENAYGGGGRDFLLGNSGANALAGADGKDTLLGGGGADTLWGGGAKDFLTGGAGKDTFFFWEYGPIYADRITDFNHGEDKIVLAQDPYMALGLGKLKSDNFVLGTKAKDADDHVVYDKKTGNLYYDPDGKGGATTGLIATFDHKPTLSASDFKIEAAINFDQYWIA